MHLLRLTAALCCAVAATHALSFPAADDLGVGAKVSAADIRQDDSVATKPPPLPADEAGIQTKPPTPSQVTAAPATPAPAPAPAPASPATPATPAPAPGQTTAAPAPGTPTTATPASPATQTPNIAQGGLPTTDPTTSGPVKSTDAMLKLAPPRFLASKWVQHRAIPTNNWWGNLIAYDKTDKSQPVWSNPYTLSVASAAPYGLQAAYSFATRSFGGSSGNAGTTAKYYLHSNRQDFVFSAKEFAGKPKFEVVDWLDLGVKLQFSSGAATMTSNLISGMPYVTVTYAAATPVIASVAAITTINGKADSSAAGNKWVVAFNNGQTWVVYSLDGAITWTKDGSSTLRASAAFSGTLRAALLTNPSQEAVFDKYKACVVKTGSVSVTSDKSYSINWDASGSCADGMLHYGLTHHVATLDAASASVVPGVSANSTTHGPMQAIVTKSNPPKWSFTEPNAFPVDFYPEKKISADVAKAQNILTHLKTDINAAWALPVGDSFYFNGKLAQKYASLCLLANVVAITGSDTSLLKTCLTKLQTVIAPFLTNGWTNQLQYDTVYRGIVSSEGFKKNDANADFGNTVYNDHHYHYGYWIATAAIMNRLAPDWNQLDALNKMATLLVRDVANFNDKDEFFTNFRNFDWYRGHSYSHGVTPFADGKDVESTSEDINSAYAIALFGKATKNARVEQVGTMMVRLNARAIKTYFQMGSKSTVHPEQVKGNMVPGIFFDNKADYSTWFSPDKACIHGIQMLPVSPITQYVRGKDFVSEEWDRVLSKQDLVVKQDTGNAWLSLLYTSYAVVNPTSAMNVLQKTTMDSGLARSWALYIAASQSA